MLAHRTQCVFDFTRSFLGLRGPLVVPFHKLYIGSIWGWGGGGGRPLPKFFGTLAFKKVVHVAQIGGWGGGRGNLDKVQKNSYFFLGNRPYDWCLNGCSNELNPIIHLLKIF